MNTRYDTWTGGEYYFIIFADGQHHVKKQVLIGAICRMRPYLAEIGKTANNGLIGKFAEIMSTIMISNKIKVLTFRRLFEYGNLNSCLCAKTHKPIGNLKEA